MSKGEFWLINFEHFANQTNFKNEKEFMRVVIRFLEEDENSKVGSQVIASGSDIYSFKATLNSTPRDTSLLLK